MHIKKINIYRRYSILKSLSIHVERTIFCPIMGLYVMSSWLWCPLWIPNKNDVRLVFTSSCLKENSCLIYVICVCLRKVVFNRYGVVFLLCLFSSCVPFIGSFLGLSICFTVPSVFSDVYLLTSRAH